MRIVIHDYGGYAFTLQLAVALAQRDHDVLYLHSEGFVTPKGHMARGHRDAASLVVQAVGIAGSATMSAGPRRLIQERRYGTALSDVIRTFLPEVVMSANSPLDAQSAALTATHSVGAAFVFWMQDHYSRAVRQLLDRRVPYLGRVVGARFARLEQRLLRASDAVVPASGSFLPALKAWNVADDRVFPIPNWAPLESVGHIPKVNPWSRQHGLDATQVVAYTGTLGRKHNPSLLVDLARGLPSARVVVVSEGVGADWLKRHADPYPNLVLLPLQAADRFPEVLGTADILVALLESDAADFSEPSKVLTYLAASRPIIAAIPAHNQAAKTIKEAGAGIVVDPTDTDGLVDAARTLLADADLREAAGSEGRRYAEVRFAIKPITDQFESVLKSAHLFSKVP